MILLHVLYKEQQSVKRWKNRSFPIYDKQVNIFGKNRAIKHES